MPHHSDASRPRLIVCFLVPGALVSTTAPHSSFAPQQREEVLGSPEIKGALKVVRAWHAGDYVAFFRAFRQQGVMHRCLMSQYVKPMRDTAIKVRPFRVLSLVLYVRLRGEGGMGRTDGKEPNGLYARSSFGYLDLVYVCMSISAVCFCVGCA